MRSIASRRTSGKARGADPGLRDRHDAGQIRVAEIRDLRSVYGRHELSGQEQIKALEEYKQALASFGQTWSDGVSETSKNMLLGDKTSVIVAGKDIIKSVISDIEAAAAMQQRALESLTAEKEKQIQTDRAWGEVLKQTAEQAATDIRYLQGVVGDLEAQITAMQKTITLTGDDQVSWVVDNIARALNSLHDKTVYITTVYRNAYGSDGGASAADQGGAEPPSWT